MKRIELPNNTMDVEAVDAYTDSGKSLTSGKFKFIGIKQTGIQKTSFIVVDTRENKLIGAYKTKMKKMEHMEMLLNRIIEDRQSKNYLGFGMYTTAWVTKTDSPQLRIPISTPDTK